MISNTWSTWHNPFGTRPIRGRWIRKGKNVPIASDNTGTSHEDDKSDPEITNYESDIENSGIDPDNFDITSSGKAQGVGHTLLIDKDKARVQQTDLKKIGDFVKLAHGVSGTAYAVNKSTILIKGFTYDGKGPDAFFL